MRVHEPDDAPETTDPGSSQYWADEEVYDGTRSPWSDDNEEWPDQEQASSNEAQNWDEGSDDEWVFDDPVADDRHAGQASEGGGGVSWEDDNDLQMGTSNVHHDHEDEISFGPEVELAGRRDVRPRPPKRPRPTQAKREQPIEDGQQPPARPVGGFRQVEEDEVAPERPYAPSPARPTSAPQSRNRFARTQATLEIDSDSPSSVSRMPPPLKNQRPPTRRRLPQPAVSVPSGKQRSRTRSPLKMLVIAALIGAGGWFAYQSLDRETGEGLIDRLSSILGVTDSGRTASDTAFGSSTSADGDPANQQQDPNTTEFLPSATDPNGQTGGSQSLPSDPAATTTDGPPVPTFKPRNDISGVTDGAEPSVQVQELDNASPADTPEEATEGPSIMQKIWGSLISQ